MEIKTIKKECDRFVSYHCDFCGRVICRYKRPFAKICHNCQYNTKLCVDCFWQYSTSCPEYYLKKTEM